MPGVLERRQRIVFRVDDDCGDGERFERVLVVAVDHRSVRHGLVGEKPRDTRFDGEERLE
ncbi:hypothetical protein [Haloarcula pelagica]|uniref:hypothetical protein n=1 Tax=Haloarcula pelagica TaxID=3033389 RepID=UPI0024C2A496|nr:hypothetical protein [Halomicroarcula sp. YJ-61-S]